MSVRRLALLPLMTIAMAACAATRGPAPPPAPIDDDAIVPYSRIGKVALGIDEATLLRWMGVPTRSAGTDVHYYARGGKYDDIVETSGGKVNRIVTSSPRFVTADGIRVGSSVLEMRAAWGEPVKSLDLHEIERFEHCFRNGLQASVDTSRSVIAAIEVTTRCNLGTR